VRPPPIPIGPAAAGASAELIGLPVVVRGRVLDRAGVRRPIFLLDGDAGPAVAEQQEVRCTPAAAA
jgi:hypothetical protein